MPFRMRLAHAAAAIVALALAGGAVADPAKRTEVILVNLTAEWCPNCRILDPRIEAAAAQFPAGVVGREVLDFTNPITSEAAFEKANGTLIAGVYADYLGSTGLGVLVAGDTGETLSCVDRLLSIKDIREAISDARRVVRDQRPGTRAFRALSCPKANASVRVGKSGN